MFPEITQAWLNVIGFHVELALHRARNEPPKDGEAGVVLDALVSVSRRTASTNALIGQLAPRLGLSTAEELVAWTLVATQLDPGLARRMEALSGGPEVTKGALLAIAYSSEPARAIRDLAPSGALLRYALVEHVDSTPASWARRTVRASERMLSLALLDSDPMPPGSAFLKPAREVQRADLAVAMQTTTALDPAVRSDAVVVVTGLPGSGKRTALTAFARAAGIHVLEVDVRALSDDLPTFTAELRTIVRESRLLGRTPLLGNIDAITDSKAQHLAAFAAEIGSQIEGGIFATASEHPPPIAWNRSVITVEMLPPSSAQRAELWRSALGAGTVGDSEVLAAQYPLAPGLIVRSARTARAQAGDREVTEADIAAGVRATLDDRLGRYGKRITVTQTWADLVLPQEHIDTLTELLSRARWRRKVHEKWGYDAKVGKGLGIVGLFSGPPGTGKTMVASLIARDLGLELYRVDIALIVSKWLGETEKQLAALFDAAEAGYAVLLFDEADSLFGKRTTVTSSNDRYANLETNYLLQRIESFSGICLLTTNNESAVDTAFLRRLSLRLSFELPDVAEREQLWRAMLPAEAPVADNINFKALAREFAMSGGYIRNAALRAAFFAANRDDLITHSDLARAAREEYRTIGKIVVG